jgi:hypothetical protein
MHDCAYRRMGGKEFRFGKRKPAIMSRECDEAVTGKGVIEDSREGGVFLETGNDLGLSVPASN